jgi:hypothetical protein
VGSGEPGPIVVLPRTEYEYDPLLSEHHIDGTAKSSLAQHLRDSQITVLPRFRKVRIANANREHRVRVLRIARNRADDGRNLSQSEHRETVCHDGAIPEVGQLRQNIGDFLGRIGHSRARAT